MGREGQRSDKKPQRRDTWSEKRTVREQQRTDKKPGYMEQTKDGKGVTKDR